MLVYFSYRSSVNHHQPDSLYFKKGEKVLVQHKHGLDV